jgi:hypothetical protein
MWEKGWEGQERYGDASVKRYEQKFNRRIGKEVLAVPT